MTTLATAVLPPVPPALAERGIALRPEAEGDTDFLARLYISTRWEELAQANWTDEQKLGFLAQQFGFQSIAYKKNYVGAARGIITADDLPAGRLYLFQFPGELRIVDISLLPEYRSRGIGSAMLQAVFAQGRERGCPVTIHVEVFNPARRLYDRLGFREVGGDNVYHKMEWRPE